MSVEYLDLVQGSYEWLKARLGMITATKTGCLMTGITGMVLGRGALTFIRAKIKEIRTGEPKPPFSSAACDFGKEWEPTAGEVFELQTGLKIKHVGFAINSNGLACSPDGLVGDAFLIEIKCPYDEDIFDSYVKKQEAPKDYLLQMLHQLMVTERGGCYFHAYNPRTQETFTKLYTVAMIEELLGYSVETYTNRALLAVQIIEIAVEDGGGVGSMASGGDAPKIRCKPVDSYEAKMMF